MDDYSPPTVSQAFGARDQAQPSTWSSKPSESYKPKPSAKLRGLIGRLGLRYHPANSADLGSHQAMLSLLVEDLADIPEDLLAEAISRHVATSQWMPKAAELRSIALSLVKRPDAPKNADDFCRVRNANLQRGDVEWFVDDNGDPQMRYRRDWETRHFNELPKRQEAERQNWLQAYRERAPA